MPYWRDPAVGLGVIMDTFKTAVTWDRFEAFYNDVRQDVQAAIKRATVQECMMSCRITHVYPDGLAPYLTIAAIGSASGDVASALAAWRDIKLAANAAVVGHGGTVTHHHAVGATIAAATRWRCRSCFARCWRVTRRCVIRGGGYWIRGCWVMLRGRWRR